MKNQYLVSLKVYQSFGLDEILLSFHDMTSQNIIPVMVWLTTLFFNFYS